MKTDSVTLNMFAIAVAFALLAMEMLRRVRLNDPQKTALLMLSTAFKYAGLDMEELATRIVVFVCNT
jgi:hypothetical protein